VEGAARPFEELFAKKALGNSFRSELVKAANDGQPFDTETGRPMAEVRARNAVTWYSHVREYMKAKWPRLAAKSRRGTVEALTDVTLAMIAKGRRGRPDAAVLREALYRYALNPLRWEDDIPEHHAAALAWLDRSSALVAELETAATVRRILDGLCTRQDGKPAAASTIRRKRAIFYNAVGYAVELGHLDSNPIDRIQWTAPEVGSVVDRRVVANPAQVAALLDGVKSLGNRADRVRAFFGCLYYAGTRPSEAADLRHPDCELPGRCLDCDTDLPDVTAAPAGSCQHSKIEYGWGRITLAGTAPRSGSAWTDDGKPHERRGLKHRARNDTRARGCSAAARGSVASPHHGVRHGSRWPAVPWPSRRPALRVGVRPVVEAGAFGSAHPGPGRLSPGEASVRPAARRRLPLAQRRCSGTEVARRLGHSVAVLLRVYANCIDGGDAGVNDRIGDALG
jgi:hypothetical protein